MLCVVRINLQYSHNLRINCIAEVTGQFNLQLTAITLLKRVALNMIFPIRPKFGINRKPVCDFLLVINSMTIVRCP